MNKKIMPPTYFFILLIISILLHFIIPIKIIIPKPFNYVGIILIILGIAMNILTDNLFKKEKTTVKPHKIPNSFIFSGPFKISRHPMYLGMFSILFGTSILLKSLISFLLPIIFALIIELFFIPNEEKNMQKKFGEKYKLYKKKVRRWI